MEPRTIVAGILFLFAAVVIGLPVLRVRSGALRLRGIVGFLMTGAGFAVLGAVAIWAPFPGQDIVTFGAVAVAFVGTIVQKRATRAEAARADSERGE